jgi:hypothetical protein
MSSKPEGLGSNVAWRSCPICQRRNVGFSLRALRPSPLGPIHTVMLDLNPECGFEVVLSILGLLSVFNKYI